MEAVAVACVVIVVALLIVWLLIVAALGTFRRSYERLRICGFSIRDLLWATLVVAMGLGWWASYRAMDARRLEAVEQAHRQRGVLIAAQTANRHLNKLITGYEHKEAVRDFKGLPVPEWSVLDEPFVEP